MPIKVSAFLRLATRAAESEVFRCARRKRQGKGERHGVIARGRAVQFMKTGCEEMRRFGGDAGAIQHSDLCSLSVLGSTLLLESQVCDAACRLRR
jgi:hypothetical protein